MTSGSLPPIWGVILMSLLEVKDLHTYYGPVHALHGASLQVEEGELVVVLGANGAGKTTLLRSLSGILRAFGGSIRFRGEEIAGADTGRIVRLGLSQVYEGREIFAPLSVRENLQLGAFVRRGRQERAEVQKDLARMLELFPILRERIDLPGGLLSGGQQQMLAMARALMSRPKLLLLDEPSMGLAPIVVREIFSIIADLRRSGTTILLVEQNSDQALRIADRAYILQSGSVVLEDTAANLMGNPTVAEAYLGGIHVA